MKQSVELEPLSAHYQFCLGTLFMNARRYDEALHELRKVLELDSIAFGVDGMILRCYYLQGQYDKAIDEARLLTEKNPGNHRLEQLRLGYIYASMGRKDDARKCIRQLHQLAGKVDPGVFAQLYARLGEKDSAFAWLDRAYQGHSGYIFYIKVTPEFDSLRGDRRYKELLRKMGFSE
jgi:tetratricopeptide (TPR) repeat protein